MTKTQSAPAVPVLPHLLLALLLAGCANPQPVRRDLDTQKTEQSAATPQQVLEQLRRGNERFASGQPQPRDMLHDQKVTAAGQHPQAIVLSCIDSRAPAEYIFDTGLGDIFNTRVAGNIADTDQVASMEYACKVAGAKLVLVMGHTSCGAVKSACDGVQLGLITGLLDKIQPAVESVHDVPGPRNSKNPAFVEAATEANVRLAIERIRSMSDILHDMETRGQIVITGCIYDLSTGRVRFFE